MTREFSSSGELIGGCGLHAKFDSFKAADELSRNIGVFAAACDLLVVRVAAWFDCNRYFDHLPKVITLVGVFCESKFEVPENLGALSGKTI